MTPLRKRMLDELQLRNLSALTTRAYIGAVERFAQYFQKSPQQLGVEQVRDYLLHLIRDRKAAPNTVMVNRSALRFLYVCTLKQSWFEENIPRPKRPPTLPDVLSAEEVTLMLDTTRNLKHWTIMATLYATALRCGELQHLKVGDVDSKHMLLHVREGKGRIPRRIGLSPVLLERLRVYFRLHRPTDWLFPSRRNNSSLLDDRSIRDLCFEAGKRAGVRHRVHPHLFRHYAASRTMPRGTKRGGPKARRMRVGCTRRAQDAAKSGKRHRRHTLATEFLAKGATFELVADILGNSPEVVRKHYGKWAKGRQDNIDQFMLAHFLTVPVTVPVTPESHEKKGPVN